MSTPANLFRFVLLKTAPPSNVLSYDSQAPLDAIFETLESHLLAAYHLMTLIHEFKSASSNTLPASAITSVWLLDDINAQLQKFDPSLGR